jgi:hypothetical protein
VSLETTVSPTKPMVATVFVVSLVAAEKVVESSSPESQAVKMKPVIASKATTERVILSIQNYLLYVRIKS